MWSRRAQEYEAKINSGDIVAIAEVVRDLYRSESQPEQSYSERQLYEAALDRLSREIAVVQHVTETEAVKEIESQLAKSPRRGAKAERPRPRAMAKAMPTPMATMPRSRTKRRNALRKIQTIKSPVRTTGLFAASCLSSPRTAMTHTPVLAGSSVAGRRLSQTIHSVV